MRNEKWTWGMAAALMLWTCTTGAAELKVWNYHVLDNALRMEKPVDPQPQPLRIVGCRNGTFSGCVAVESTEPIADFRTNLRAEGGEKNPLAGSGVQLRTAVRWPEAQGLPPGLDILLESPPEEIPVREGRALAGAWITVSVPSSTPPGLYRAVLELSARDAKPVRVPVELQVESWTLPNPPEWRTWIEMIQSPDTLSLEYGLPLWSERHWAMIAHSFKLMRGTGTRTVYVPILRETNQGNEESMIRWIREKDGSLRPDFSIMERYLDTAQEQLGDLKQVIFYAWDAYLVTAWRDRRFDERPDQPGQEQQRWDLRQKGLMITIVDEATGETQPGHLPLYTDGSSVEIWKPFYRELRGRMRKRGLEDAMLLGMVTDMEPSKEEIRFFHEVTGGLPWAAHSHYRRTADKPAPNTVLHGLGSVGYECHAYSLDYQVHPSKPALHGWRVPELRSYLCRFGLLNGHPLRVRTMPEVNITGNQRGVGRLGADFWSVLRDRRGQRRGQVFERYPHNHWRGLNINNWFLAPGPEGPVGTARLENLREGVQECEALIFLKETLLDDARRSALDVKTGQETRETLDERHLALWHSYWPNDEHLALLGTISGRSMHEALWSGLTGAGVDLPGFWEEPARSLLQKMEAQGIADFVNSEWQVRTRKLFRLAGETARWTEVPQ